MDGLEGLDGAVRRCSSVIRLVSCRCLIVWSVDTLMIVHMGGVVEGMILDRSIYGVIGCHSETVERCICRWYGWGIVDGLADLKACGAMELGYICDRVKRSAESRLSMMKFDVC